MQVKDLNGLLKPSENLHKLFNLLLSSMDSEVYLEIKYELLLTDTSQFQNFQGIQALYGRKTNGAQPPTLKTTKKPTVQNDNVELCSNAKIDAIFNTADGNTYALKGDKYYRLTENAIADGYPKKISDGWPGLECK